MRDVHLPDAFGYFDVDIGGQALIVARIGLSTRRPIVWWVPDDRWLQDRVAAVTFWLRVLAETDAVPPVVPMPDYDRTPFLPVETHPSIVETRLHAWSVLAGSSPWVLILPVSAMLRRMPPLDTFRRLQFTFHRDEDIPRDFLLELLNEYGYRPADTVQQPGDFAVRGAIVDLFPPGYAFPIRLEFFDERLDDIRTFDPATQISRDTLPDVRILPWVEFPMQRQDMQRWMERAARCIPPERWSEAFQTAQETWSETGRWPGYEDYIGWWMDRLQPWWEILSDARWVISEPQTVAAQMATQYTHLTEAVRHARAQGTPAPDPSCWLIAPPPVDAWTRILHVACVLSADHTPPAHWPDCVPLRWRAPARYDGQMHRFVRDCQAFLRAGTRCVVVLRSETRAERMQALLRERLMQSGPVVPPERVRTTLQEERIVLTVHDLTLGLEAPDLGVWVMPENLLFGEIVRLEPRHHVPLERAQAMDLADLHPGDYVVHEDHGIGRFVGLERVRYGQRMVETVVIEYAGGDRLLVPMDRIDVVKKYIGPSETPPALDKLGGKTWQARKRRARQAVESIIRELVDLYAARQVAEGTAFPPDDELQAAFEAAFPYELTPDQRRAIAEIKRDMEQPRVMDRLLCGDVGFGKTEVAMRAAMKAVLGGKQVAVLVPTTVLAFQHYMTFTQRFAAFPVRIAMISRLVPPGEQQAILQALKKGEIDIVIGTHRLLSKDVEFFDLGLIIIDEEQRFGVLQKERLKQLRRDADVLSMTATPIPRTLQMALTGLMQISLIRTPPRDRLAVQTHVVHFSPDVIRFAVEHELDRGGQVYFVHNEIETLPRMAALVQELCPMARIAVAHGRLSPRRLEDIMLRFMQGEIDVLVSTVIIENGIDIPNVNTLIVNNAHRFGLAQLYQLRGRVGRSYRRAYAYLMVPPMAQLSDVARRRLAALREFTELGSGFRLATLDLELRGAGELLGKKQHGHIQALGLDAYLEILREAVAELRRQPYRPPIRPNVRLPVDAYIPDDYMPAERHRMYYYRALAEADTHERVEAIAREIRDLYGPLPEPVRHLVEVAHIRVICRHAGVQEIAVQDGQLTLRVQVRDDQAIREWIQRVQTWSDVQIVPPDRVVVRRWPRSQGPAAWRAWLAERLR